MRIVAAIPARLDSTRLPKKLLREICGKSLIARTYEATVNSNLFDDVLVITNSREIISELENSKIKYIFGDANYQTSFLITRLISKRVTGFEPATSSLGS